MRVGTPTTPAASFLTVWASHALFGTVKPRAINWLSAATAVSPLQDIRWTWESDVPFSRQPNTFNTVDGTI